jgi:hypothetical protein
MIPDTTTAYALGQLTAVLARADAFRNESRAVEIATLTPGRILLPAITEAKRKGMSKTLGERTEEIMAGITAIPTRALNNEEQGVFQLGYYHERSRLRGGRPPKVQSDATLTARMELLLEPTQKEWVMAHGGAEYVRRLIAADYTSQS